MNTPTYVSQKEFHILKYLTLISFDGELNINVGFKKVY